MLFAVDSSPLCLNAELMATWVLYSWSHSSTPRPVLLQTQKHRKPAGVLGHHFLQATVLPTLTGVGTWDSTTMEANLGSEVPCRQAGDPFTFVFLGGTGV
jgi:hypothetical protein